MGVTNYRTRGFIRHTCEAQDNSFKPAPTNYRTGGFIRHTCEAPNNWFKERPYQLPITNQLTAKLLACTMIYLLREPQFPAQYFVAASVLILRLSVPETRSIL